LSLDTTTMENNTVLGSKETTNSISVTTQFNYVNYYFYDFVIHINLNQMTYYMNRTWVQ